MKPSEILSDSGYSRLKEHVIAQTGLAFFEDKDADFTMRLARRFEALNVRSCAAYLQILRGRERGPAESDELVGELTIGETYFFRQREHFDALRQTVIPELLERNRSRRKLRIWSAGCATGAEPYSIALLLVEFAPRTQGWDIAILGTDINRAFLERARSARFDDWTLRASSEEFKTRFFERDHKRWVLRPEFRKGVSFEYHNLATDPAPIPLDSPGFDLIFCRNVLIYFGRDRIETTAARLYDALAPGGWLLVGHAELNTSVFARFRTVFTSGAVLYQKAPAGNLEIAPPAELPQLIAAPPPPAPAPPVPAEPPADGAELREVRTLADRGRWDEAVARSKALIERDGLNAAAHFTYALILEHTGPQDEAEQYLRRALYLDRGFTLAHYHLGLCLQRKGAAGRARRAFMNAMDLLALRPDEEAVEHGDGITVAELRDSARMHLDLLKTP